MNKSPDLIKKKMEAESNDEVKILNPTNEDYHIKYGGRYWTVPAKTKDVGYGSGALVVLRYIAMNYIQHMIDKLILDESNAKMEKMKKEYKGDFWPGQEERFALRTNNPELRKKYLSQVWGGVVRRFGMDEIPTQVGEAKPRSDKSLDEQMLEELEENPVKNIKEELLEAINEN